MRNIRLIIAGLTILLGSSVAALSAVQSANADELCIVAPVMPYRNLTVNPDHTITGTFEVKGNADCTQPVSLMTFYADTNLLGSDKFYSNQVLKDVQSQTFGVGVHQLTAKLPVCSSDTDIVHAYQADIVATAQQASFTPTAAVPSYYVSKQADGNPVVVDWKVDSGNCPATTTNTTTTTPAATVTTVSKTTAQPTALVNTGPGDVAAMFAIATLGGAFLHRKLAAKRI